MAKNKDTDVLVEEVEDMGAEPRVYELGFHLDPELPTEEAKKAYQAIRAGIAEKGTVVVEAEPEKLQLAYTVYRQEVGGRRDFDSAYFAWIAYEMLASDHATVIASANENKAIIRFIDLTTTKEAARLSLEAYELSKKAAPAEADETIAEDVLATEIDAALEATI